MKELVTLKDGMRLMKNISYPSNVQDGKWSQPPLNWIKLNVDVALDATHNRISIRCVLKYCEGTFKIAKQIPWKGVHAAKNSMIVQFSFMATSSSHYLEVACASLMLTEEEGDLLIVSENDTVELAEDYGFALVGKLATNKSFKFHYQRDIMATIWKLCKGMRVFELAPNPFLFQFYHEVDVNRIEEDSL
nr:uncharacterized protein LOC109179748 [Ipomoea batatas]